VSTGSGNRRERRSGAARPTAGRYPTVYRRDALAPGLLGAVALLAGLALLTSEAFFVIRLAAAILALIMLVFALQARHWWWTPPLAAVAVVWNPVVPLPLAGQGWALAQIAGAAVLVAAGLTIKRPDPGDRSG
jgi:hypothetical protein